MVADNIVYTTDNAPQKDWFLQFLVNIANKSKFELEITLTVGGLLISGTLSGVRQYFEDLSAYFASPFESDSKSGEIQGIFQKIGDQCTCVAPAEQTETPAYIHLKNATMYDAHGNVMQGGQGVWWRGRISEVQGFAPGNLYNPTPSRQQE